MLLVYLHILHVLPLSYTSTGNMYLCSCLLSKSTTSELFGRNKGININKKNKRFIRSSQSVSGSSSHLRSLLKNLCSVLEIESVIQFIAG